MAEPAPEVEQVVRDWLNSKQLGDRAGITARLSRYEGALAVGTGAEEWFRGADEFTDAHASPGAFAAVIDSVEAHSSGPVAWAAVRAVIETGGPGGFPLRLTLVLVRDQGNGDWRIVQSHASAPA